jgi:hypothetical protein
LAKQIHLKKIISKPYLCPPPTLYRNRRGASPKLPTCSISPKKSRCASHRCIAAAVCQGCSAVCLASSYGQRRRDYDGVRKRMKRKPPPINSVGIFGFAFLLQVQLRLNDVIPAGAARGLARRRTRIDIGTHHACAMLLHSDG